MDHLISLDVRGGPGWDCVNHPIGLDLGVGGTVDHLIGLDLGGELREGMWTT